MGELYWRVETVLSEPKTATQKLCPSGEGTPAMQGHFCLDTGVSAKVKRGTTVITYINGGMYWEIWGSLSQVKRVQFDRKGDWRSQSSSSITVGAIAGHWI